MSNISFDPVWEEKYQAGHSQKYPWDHVVSFICKAFPEELKRSGIKVLEVGCGTGSNLWFAAREGFDVVGVDASESAINFVKNRFEQEKLSGEFIVSDFNNMDFKKETFDLVIDRAAITCCDLLTAKEVVKNIQKILKNGGLFLFNPYSSTHSSFNSGIKKDNGLVMGMTRGSLQGSGQICMYTEEDVDSLFSNGWGMKSKKHLQIEESLNAQIEIHSEWRIIAEKQKI